MHFSKPDETKIQNAAIEESPKKEEELDISSEALAGIHKVIEKSPDALPVDFLPTLRSLKLNLKYIVAPIISLYCVRCVRFLNSVIHPAAPEFLMPSKFYKK